jgi:hypothetical protein
LMRMQIRMRIQVTKMMRILADPQHGLTSRSQAQVTQSSWSHFLLPGGRRAARGTTSVPSPGAGVGAEGRGGYSWEEGRDGDTYAGLQQITFNFRKKFGLNLLRLFVVLIRIFLQYLDAKLYNVKIFLICLKKYQTCS